MSIRGQHVFKIDGGTIADAAAARAALLEPEVEKLNEERQAAKTALMNAFEITLEVDRLYEGRLWKSNDERQIINLTGTGPEGQLDVSIRHPRTQDGPTCVAIDELTYRRWSQIDCAWREKLSLLNRLRDAEKNYRAAGNVDFELDGDDMIFFGIGVKEPTAAA